LNSFEKLNIEDNLIIKDGEKRWTKYSINKKA
jgi:hypothetical protein